MFPEKQWEQYRSMLAMENNYELSVMQDESGAETSVQRKTSLPRWNPKQYSVATLAALGCAVQSCAQNRLYYLLQMDNQPDEVLMQYIGACAGSLLTLALMDVYGRKFAAVAIATINVLYFLMLLVVPFSNWFHVAAVVVGFGTGGIPVVIPTYLVEIAEENSRGRMGVIILVMRTFGVFIANSVQLISREWTEHFFSMVLGFLFLGASVWIPETPYFLISTGRRDEALHSLRRLRVDVVENEQKLQVLEESTQEYAQKYSTWWARLANREAIKAVAVAAGLMILQLKSLTFMGHLYYLLHTKHIPAALCIVRLLHLVLAFVPLLLVDWVQRRLLLMTSAVGTAVCCGVFALMEYEDSFEDYLVVKITIDFVLVIMSNLGMSCLPWIISAELMPNGVRAIGCATVMCIVNTSTYIYMYLTQLYYITYMYYVVNCSFSITCFMYVLFILTETKGKIL